MMKIAVAVTTLASVATVANANSQAGVATVTMERFADGVAVAGELTLTTSGADGTTVTGTIIGTGVCDADVAGDTKAGCGMHIHSGYSCDDAGTQGGHYWVGDVADPWKAAPTCM